MFAEMFDCVHFRVLAAALQDLYVVALRFLDCFSYVFSFFFDTR